MRTITIVLMVAFVVATAAGAQTLIGQPQIITVERGDTLRSLGSRLGIDPATIASDNGRRADVPLQAGETLTIDNRHIIPSFPAGTSMVINVPQRMLFFVREGGTTGYPVAVGRASWPTPLGTFSIATKETNPTWDVPESIRAEALRAGRSLPLKVPPGPNNPLGAHWMGLSGGSVGVHGTNAPNSVYQATTHGCIRLRPDDIAAVFAQTPIGAPGVLVYQPILVGVDSGRVFVEAHRDVYRRGPTDTLDVVRTGARELGVSARVDWDLVVQVIQARAGVARDVTLRERP
jgi:L,D-transpeptidase ErfK/SrfK